MPVIASNNFLEDLAFVLSVAAVISVVFQALRQPVVVGYLVAGMLVGPYLPFPLLADAKGELAKRYGSLRDLGLIRFARRNTFLIDPQGRVAKVYLSANTSRNSREVIEDLKKLTAK